MKIPKILLLFWHNKTMIPPEIASAIAITTRSNPD